MLKYRREFRRLHRTIWGALALLILLGFLLQNVAGSAYYSLLMQPDTTVTAPPVILQEGTAENCTTTIYTNNTSARVSVDPSETDVKDYVDDDTSDVDNSTDIGTHSNFTAQQYGPDLINDTLTEGNTGVSEQQTLRPNANGYAVEWTISDTTHYGATSDQNDTTYVYSSTLDSKEFLNLDDPTFSESDTINWIQVHYRMYATGTGGPEKVDLYIRSDSTDTETDIKVSITRDSWNDYAGTNQTTNPATGSPWTKSEVAGLQAGIIVDTISGGEEIRCSEIWVTVDYTPPNYKLDLEVQWTSADYDESYEELCIYGGTMGAENITVDVWNGSDWENLLTYLDSGWNNKSVSSYLNSSTFTIRFKGDNETNDATQDTWDIDATLLHVWTIAGDFNYVLNMTENHGSNWTVRLTAYDNSSLTRLDNCSIYIYDGSNSTQIVILNGEYENQTGPWYDLAALDTIYIWMHVETSGGGTSYVYAYLEILVPDTTTYARYIITFEIT